MKRKIPLARTGFAEGFFYIDDSDYGTKVRLAEQAILGMAARDFYFAATHTGDSPRAIGKICAMHDRKLHAFYPSISEDNYTPAMKQAQAFGVNIHTIDTEDEEELIRRAHDAAEENNGAYLNFRGRQSIQVVTDTVKEAVEASNLQIKYIFSASSTGSMAQGLQDALPNIEHHVVRVSRAPKANFGNAIVHEKGSQQVRVVEGLNNPLNADFEGWAWPVMKQWATDNNISKADIGFFIPAKGFGI